MPQRAQAHIGNKDIFEQIEAGPYKLFVTVRPPLVIPGVATIEVRSGGAAISELNVTPVPMVGEASKHPPAPDAMKRSAADPQFFTGSLWLMGSGSWKVQFGLRGAAGQASASIPVPAMPTAVLRMNRSLGLLLGALGLLLAIGFAGIVAAATRESRLEPGAVPNESRRRRALIAGSTTLALVAVVILLAGKWWDVEAADYADNVYRPSDLRATLQGDELQLAFGHLGSESKHWKFDHELELLPDHGHLMHLYVIRDPGMDAVFHLHPAEVAPGKLQTALPALPPGHYRLFADIVHRSGFPETLTAQLDVPANLKAAALDSEDAAGAPPPLSAGELGAGYKLPDGYTMTWDRPAELVANQAYNLRFRLLDPAGQPARDMQPYRYGRSRRFCKNGLEHLRPHAPRGLRRHAGDDAGQWGSRHANARSRARRATFIYSRISLWLSFGGTLSHLHSDEAWSSCRNRRLRCCHPLTLHAERASEIRSREKWLNCSKPSQPSNLGCSSMSKSVIRSFDKHLPIGLPLNLIGPY